MLSSSSIRSIEIIANKWELARRLTSTATAPEQALKSIYSEAIQELQQTASIELTPSTKERIWTTTSPKKLLILKETLTLEVYNKILNEFEDNEINEMLIEHKDSGMIRNIMSSACIQTFYALHQKSILESIIQKAESIKKIWLSEILIAIKKKDFPLA